jgi:flagellar basal body-associated protein FliL
MRHISIIAAVVWVAVIVALVGATAMIAHVPQRAEAATASGSTEVNAMTGNAKALPIEQFDAI